MMTFLLLLIIGTFLCLLRVAMGPTAPDRAVAIDTIGVMVVGQNHGPRQARLLGMR